MPKKIQANVKLEQREDGQWDWTVTLPADVSPNGRDFFYSGTVMDQADAKSSAEGAVQKIRDELNAPSPIEYTVDL